MKRYHHLFWTEDNVLHIARHGVTPDEAEQVVFSLKSKIRKGRGQDIYISLGQTDSSRYLFIVLVDMGDRVAKVVTARDMTHKEKKWYRR